MERGGTDNRSDVRGASRLAISEWLAIACSATLVVSLFAFPWFGFSLDGDVVPGSTGDAFRWLHGLDLVLLLAGAAALLATLLRLAGPVGPGTLLAGLIAGIVATLLIIGLMAWPPDGGEAVFGAFGGDPAGELVPQRGAVIGFAAALGIVVTGWLGIGRRMEAVAASQASHAPSPVPAPESSPVAPTPPVATAAPIAPVVTDAKAALPAKPRATRKPKPKPKPATTAKSAAKPRATGAKRKASPAKKRTAAAKRKPTRTRKPPKSA